MSLEVARVVVSKKVRSVRWSGYFGSDVATNSRDPFNLLIGKSSFSYWN